jgi:hypothetical protein
VQGFAQAGTEAKGAVGGHGILEAEAATTPADFGVTPCVFSPSHLAPHT